MEQRLWIETCGPKKGGVKIRGWLESLVLTMESVHLSLRLERTDGWSES